MSFKTSWSPSDSKWKRAWDMISTWDRVEMLLLEQELSTKYHVTVMITVRKPLPDSPIKWQVWINGPNRGLTGIASSYTSLTDAVKLFQSEMDELVKSKVQF